MTGARPDPSSADTSDAVLREHLAWQLAGGYARSSLRDAVEGLSPEECGRVPSGAAHSVWQILAHIEVCLRDLLEYTRTPGHESPAFPEGLWLTDKTPPSETAVTTTLDAIDEHHRAFIELIRDPRTDLTTPLAHANGRTALRQILIAIDHESYHIGQLTVTRALLDGSKG